MRILVTGGAGFIGSLLCEELLNLGHDIVCVDNLSLGSKKNIEHILDVKNFSFIEADAADLSVMQDIFKSRQIDYVYHLAANSDIQAGGKNPDIDFKNTFLTTYTILSCMKEFGVKKMFFSSTSAVYGEKKDVKIKEDCGDLRPISNYGGAKLASESFISSFSHMNDIEVLMFRFPNVIGPRLTHGVLFDFLKKLKANNSELEIFGDGKQCKPYIHVQDLVDVIILQSLREFTGINIYNIGVESSTTVTRIAEILCEELGLKGVKLKYTGGDRGWKGDVPVFSYDLSKIFATGWYPKYSSDEAVRATARYLREVCW